MVEHPFSTKPNEALLNRLFGTSEELQAESERLAAESQAERTVTEHVILEHLIIHNPLTAQGESH